MEIPWRRVDQCDIGNQDLIGVHDLDEVSASEIQFFAVELIPPSLPLSIDGPIVPWN